MKLWLRLYGFEPCSWTFVWENLRQAFLDAGDDVADVVDPDEPEDYVEAWWGDPQFWRWSSLPVRNRVSLCLSEARSILHQGRPETINNLRNSDLIICPSEAATTAFREAPIDVPIRVAPFGVNTSEFKFVSRNWDSDGFRFLHAGVTQFRKGSWLVPEAFISEFSPKEDVHLTIASYKASPMFTRLKLEYGGHKQIDFISELQDSSMDLYKAHHCFVSPHLSEGYGLMIPEAMATGMPCLVARCSAPREYFDKKYGWWIEMSEDYGPVEACLPNTVGFWRLPDRESLAAVMREVYERRDEAARRGCAGSKFVAKNLTWRHTITEMKSVMKEVLGEEGISDTAGIQRGKVVAIRAGEPRAAR